MTGDRASAGPATIPAGAIGNLGPFGASVSAYWKAVWPAASGHRQGVLIRYSVLPGFGLTLGLTLIWLGLIVLVPLAGLTLHAAGLGWSGFWHEVLTPRVVASFRVSFTTALGAAVINVVFGLLVAWVLVRYRFPGQRLIDALVDLPFALPTAVAGIALTSLYATNGWIGAILADWGIKVAFTPLGIVVALTFIGLPFVVRTVEPVLQELPPEEEEAAMSLGASRWQTFARVILPAITPALNG